MLDRRGKGRVETACAPPTTGHAATTSRAGAPRDERPALAERGRILIVFAGTPRAGDLSDAFERLGWGVDALDIRVGGDSHDVARAEVHAALEEALRAGEYS